MKKLFSVLSLSKVRACTRLSALRLTLVMLLATLGANTAWGQTYKCGFEDGVDGWGRSSMSSGPTLISSSESAADVRTGKQSIQYVSSTSLGYTTKQVSFTKNKTIHVISWVKTSSSKSMYWSLNGDNAKATTVGTDWTRLTHSYSYTSSTGNKNVRLYMNDKTQNVNIFIDDVIVYESGDATTDLTRPTSATNPTASTSRITWDNGSDAGTDVQATLIFRRKAGNVGDKDLSLNDQGVYSLTATEGPSTVGNWVLVNANILPTAISFGGTFTAGDEYAIVHRDLAYNYSVPTYVTVSNPTPPTPTSKTIYCKMEYSWWTVDGAAIGAYCWNSADDKQRNAGYPGIRMTPVDGESNMWSYEVSDIYDRVIFTRVNGNGDIVNWSAKTKNQTIPSNKNLFTITSSSAVWGDPGCDGEWSTYSPTPQYTGLSVSADPAAGGSPTISATSCNQGSSVTVNAHKNSGYNFSGWTSDAGTFGDASNAETTFTPSADNAVAVAHYTAKPWQIKSSFDDWTVHDLTGTSSAASYTYTGLAAGKTYDFGLMDPSGTFFKDGAIDSDHKSATLNSSSGSNATITTTIAGDYTFSVDYTNASAPVVTVTYPDPAPCATMGPITSSVSVANAPVDGLTLSDASVGGKTVDANSNGLKLGGNDSRLKVTLDEGSIVENTKIIIYYKNPSSNSGIGVFNGDYAHQVVNLTGVSATGSVTHVFTAAEAANYSDAFIITRNATGASNYINAIEVFNCGPAIPKHHVTYAKGEDEVTGTLPTQPDVKENATFTVAAVGDLARDGYDFAGWSDGATTYQPGDSYTMSTSDVTLTAQWNKTLPSTDATLSAIMVNDAPIAGFDSEVVAYNVELPFGTVAVPTVTVTKHHSKASTEITNAVSLPGTTTILVTAEDETTTKTYTVNLSVASSKIVDLVWRTGQSACAGAGSQGSIILSSDAKVSSFIQQITFDNVSGSGADAAEASGSSLNTGKKAGNTIIIRAQDGYAFTQMSFFGKIESADAKIFVSVDDGANWFDVASTSANDVTYCDVLPDLTLTSCIKIKSAGAAGAWIRNMQLSVTRGLPKHHVTYAKGEGEVTGDVPTQPDVTENATFTVAAVGDLARDGYDFAGWSDGTTTYQPGDSYTMSTSDVTLTAQWTLIPTTYYVYLGETLTLPAGAVYTKGTATPAQYASQLLPEVETSRYEDGNDLSGNTYTANTLGQFVITKDGSTDITVYVYRFYAKHPWGCCEETASAIHNMSWVWRAMDRIGGVTGEYGKVLINDAPTGANLAWDYAYDWDGIYQMDGSSSGIYQPSDTWVDGTKTSTGASIWKKMGTTGTCGETMIEFQYSNLPATSTTEPSLDPSNFGGENAGAITTHTLIFAAVPEAGGMVSTDWGASSPIKVKAGVAATFNAVANANYRFVGWFATDECSGEALSTNPTLAVDEVTDNVARYAKFEATAPGTVTISSENGQWLFWNGDQIRLTATTQNPLPAEGVTYTWKKNGVVIPDETEAALTIVVNSPDPAGAYTCEVSFGGDWVASNSLSMKIAHFYIQDNSGNPVTDGMLTRVDQTTEGTFTYSLNGNLTYRFYLNDGCTDQYGWTNNTITEGSCTGKKLYRANDPCQIQTSKTGSYTFRINVGSFGSEMALDVTYPSSNQAAGYKIYFERPEHSEESSEYWPADKVYYRIGHSKHTQATPMTKVPGTENLYKVTTAAYDGFAAWHIANNSGWTGSNTIYRTVAAGYDITNSMSFSGDAVTTDVTIILGNDHSTGESDENNNCEFYSYTQTPGLLTHTATIEDLVGGTITVAYTDINGVAQAVTETTSNLAHTCILTITAAADGDYTLTSLTVNGEPFTSGSTHILSADATIAAVFTPKTYNIYYKDQYGADYSGSNLSALPNSYVYGVGVPLVDGVRTGYTFDGWYGSQECDGTRLTEMTTTDSGNKTRFAKWTPNANTPYAVKHFQQNFDGTYPAEPYETENLTGTTAAEVTPAVKSYTGFTAPATQTVAILADGSLVVNYYYTRNSYNLTWDFAGGATTTPEAEYTHGTVKYGATITSPADPTKDGNTFSGWSAEVPATMPASDLTLTAQWTAKNYASSVDFEAAAIAGEKSVAEFLEENNYTYTGSATTWDNTTSSNNGAYVGLKIKKANSTVEFLVGSRKLVVLKVGFLDSSKSDMYRDGVRVAESMTGGSKTAGQENFKIHYFYSDAEAQYMFKTTADNTQVIKAIKIEAPYVVTFTNGGAIAPMTFTGTPLDLPAAAGEGIFQGWFDAAVGGNKIGDAGEKYTPTASIELFAHFQDPTIIATLRDLQVNATTVAGFDPDVTNYAVALPYGTKTVPTVTATPTIDGATAVVTPAGAIPGTATVLVTAQDGKTQKTYTIDFSLAPKTGYTLIKATHKGASTADVEGEIGGTVDKNTQAGGKLGNDGHYFGIKLAEGTFLAGDVLTIYASTTSNKVQIFSDKGTNMLNEGVFNKETGIYTFTLTAATEWIYLYRTSSQMNPTLGYMEVTRTTPMIKSFGMSGQLTMTVDQENHVITGLVPTGTDLTSLTPNVFEFCTNDNENATISPAKTAAQNFNNPVKYTVTDADGDATTYVVRIFPETLTRSGIGDNSRLGTICYPYEITAIGSDAKLYSISHKLVRSDGKAYQIVFSEVDFAGGERTVAGQPYIFSASTEHDLALTFDKTSTPASFPTEEVNGLNGVFETTYFSDLMGLDVAQEESPYYVVKNNKIYHSVWSAPRKSGANAYRAYIVMEDVPVETQDAPSRPMVLDIDGISFIPTGVAETTDADQARKVLVDGNIFILRGAKVFDLNGRLLRVLTK